MSKSERPVILAVDDDPDILAFVARALRDEYSVLTAADASAALQLVDRSPRPDLILLDIEMPDASGFELCRVLKGQGSPSADIPVIFLTANTDARSQVEGFELGAVDYVTKPIGAAVLRARVRTQLALANRRLELERLVGERTVQLEQTRLQLIRRLARAMERHESSVPGNRVTRVSQYARVLAEAAHATPAVCEMLMTVAPLHDIGKLGVPAKLLRKGKLSALERERVKRYPRLGAEIIGEHDDPMLNMAREIALHHCERWDGRGYPEGLKGNDIPWAARLMAIVAAFESMTTAQDRRSPLTALKAVARITDDAGTRFDPLLVEAFTRAVPLMCKVREVYADHLGDLIDLDFSIARRSKAAQPVSFRGPVRLAKQARVKR